MVGLRGAGKTTLAIELSSLSGFKRIGLDAIILGPDRHPRENEHIEADLHRLLPEDRWIVDGHVSSIPPIVWRRATTVIWLDYPRRTLIARQLHRARSHRGLFRRVLVAGGAVSPDVELTGEVDDAVPGTRRAETHTRPWQMLWMALHRWRTHGKKRAMDDAALRRLEANGCSVIRIRSDRQRKLFVESLTPGARRWSNSSAD